MIRLYTDHRMLDHLTPGGHPERPQRLQAITRHLDRVGLAQACRTGPMREATSGELLRVHHAALVERVARVGETGLGGYLDADTWAGPGSLRAACLAAGAAVEAVQGVMSGRDRMAFCAVRPPGHHATASTAMGFCLFNAVAVAAAHARAMGVDRVLVVDFDVHHGNGTQDIFYDDGQVGFLSIHRYPFYPGTGAAGETGRGDGLGATCNVPIAFGTPVPEYHAAFRSSLADMADRIKPQLVLISAGFDAHHDDPVGGLGLEVDDFRTLTAELLDVARTHAGGRLVSVLEGGYDLAALALSVAAHLEALGVEPAHELGPH
jgi:acetoin utilization deacetylase AcuC-like enzyme